MERINLTKYGFRRAPQEDFTDDGTRFTCYRIGNVRVSKATYENYVYIAGRRDKGNLMFAQYSALPHYNDLDLLNGVDRNLITEQQLIDFAKACIEYDKEYTKAERALVFPTIDEINEQYKKIIDHYQKQLDDIDQAIKDNAVKLFLQMTPHDRKTLLDNRSFIESGARFVDSYASSIFRTGYSIDFVRPDNYDLTYTYYYDRCKSLIDSYK